MRIAAITLLDGFMAANPTMLKHTFRARPASIMVPCAFVDGIDEDIAYTPAGAQRTPDARIRIVRGTFGAGDVADANDELIDDFIDYVVDNLHAAGPNTLALITSVEDDDGWIPEWMPADKQLPYFSTILTLSGEGLVGGVV